MSLSPREEAFRWDQPTGFAACLAAALALVPTAGWLLAWHQAADLRDWSLRATLPALVLMAGTWGLIVRRHPVLRNRLSVGLLAGFTAVLAFDLVRAPFTWWLPGAPDWVPMIGQALRHEPAGIAPTPAAASLGLAYHWLLGGALLGLAYASVIGKGRWYWGLIAGLVAGVGFTALPQARLLAVATGFTPMLAGAVWLAAFGAAGAVLGALVQRLGRTNTNTLYVAFLREHPLERPTVNPLGR